MFKIISSNKIIDVIKNPQYIRFIENGHICKSTESNAHGLLGSDNKKVYRFDLKAKTTRSDILDVQLIPIRETEFNKLVKLIEAGELITADKTQLDKAKRLKIEELSNICNKNIIAGFSIILSDNQVHHFKLTIEDQINLMLLESQYNKGVETFIYHSTNNSCRVFGREDMFKVLSNYKKHIQYHTTLFNLLKQHIKALSSIEAVWEISYDFNINNLRVDQALKTYLKNLK